MRILKISASYLIAPIISLILVSLFFQLWNFDLKTPIFSYSKDSLFHLFLVKLIASEGWFFSSEFVGYPQSEFGFYLHDFPIHADFFNFALIKIFSYFTKDPFLLVNIFFLFTFLLNSLGAFIALRAFKIGLLSATLIAILYSFLPYHFARGAHHLFLSNYVVIPLLIMSSLWICDGKIILLKNNSKDQLSLAPNRLFFATILVAIFAAISGIYYAFYALVIFTFAWFICGLKNGKFLNRQIFTLIAICAATLLTLLVLYFPVLKFWAVNGFNVSIANRDYSQSEFFALRIADLLMPVANHYFDYLRDLRTSFDFAFNIEDERRSSTLGILGSGAFIFLLIWLLLKSQISNSLLQKNLKKFSLSKNDKSLISNLASLNLLSILFATAGGLVLLLVLSFPLIRSHARFCIFIAFFALFLVAIFFDKMAQKSLKAKLVIIVISILALFDQVGNLSNFEQQAQARVRKFNIDQQFVTKAQIKLKAGAQVFILPVFGFPEGSGDQYSATVFYLISKNLKVSYPVIKGRKAHLWQERVVNLKFKQFILELKKAGFSAIAIERNNYVLAKKNSWKNLRKLETNLKSLDKKPIVSKDLNWILFKI